MDMLQGKKVLTRDGNVMSIKALLKDKDIVVYYFSASFVNDGDVLHNLKMVYNESIKREIGMEVIYVSYDSHEEDYQQHFFLCHGPWLAILFKDPVAMELIYCYGISSLPALVVVNKEGDIITKTGREELLERGINVLVTWTEYQQQ